MKIKLLTFYKGPQFAKNPLKSYMRQQEAFRADIFFKFDLENDLFSCNQAALWMVFSVRLSVRHTFLTMFPSSYHHEIFRSYHLGPG